MNRLSVPPPPMLPELKHKMLLNVRCMVNNSNYSHILPTSNYKPFMCELRVRPVKVTKVKIKYAIVYPILLTFEA